MFVHSWCTVWFTANIHTLKGLYNSEDSYLVEHWTTSIKFIFIILKEITNETIQVSGSVCHCSFPLTSFQDDKDLVHEFVVAEGLTCLIKVGAEADQNYQNYILRGKSTGVRHSFSPINSPHSFPLLHFLTPQFTTAGWSRTLFINAVTLFFP